MAVHKLKIQRKRFVVPGLLLIIGGVFFGINHVISAPSHGTATSTPGIVAKVQPKTVPKTQTPVTPAADNSYYSLSLPASFKTQNGGDQTPGVLAQQRYVKASIDGSQLVVISIEQLPSSGLSQLSSYQLRTSGNGRFIKTTKNVSGKQVEIFRDSQSASAVAFWTHNNVVATIGVNAALQDMTDEANTKQLSVVDEILNSWQWR